MPHHTAQITHMGVDSMHAEALRNADLLVKTPDEAMERTNPSMQYMWRVGASLPPLYPHCL